MSAASEADDTHKNWAREHYEKENEEVYRGYSQEQRAFAVLTVVQLSESG